MFVAQHTPEIRISGAKLTRNSGAPDGALQKTGDRGGARDVGQGTANTGRALLRCTWQGLSSAPPPCSPSGALHVVGQGRPKFHAPAPGVVQCRAPNFALPLPEANTSPDDRAEAGGGLKGVDVCAA